MITIKKASITRLGVDAVVNAANEQLLEGGGVCGAIFAAAGSAELQTACDALSPCKTGSAVITPAFGLKNNKYIIHAVGPVWKGGKNREAIKLYSAYQKALALAEENHCESIGFPLISAGIYGVPLDIAWRKALQACISYCCDHDMEIVFAVPDKEIREMGERIFQEQIVNYPAYLKKMVGSESIQLNSVGEPLSTSDVMEKVSLFGDRLTDQERMTLALLETIRSMNQTMTREELEEQLISLEQPFLEKLLTKNNGPSDS